MSNPDTKVVNLNKKRSPKSGSEYLRARKFVQEAIQALGNKKECIEELKAISERLLDKFVEEERKPPL